MEKKQTAVEWFVDQMIKQMCIRIENTTIGCELLEQANKIFEQQIIDAHGVKTESINQDQSKIVTGNQYYNKTFNK